MEDQQELEEIEFSNDRRRLGSDNPLGTALTVTFSVGCPSHGHKNTSTLGLAMYTTERMYEGMVGWFKEPLLLDGGEGFNTNTPNPFSIGCSDCGDLFIIIPRNLERLKREGQEFVDRRLTARAG